MTRVHIICEGQTEETFVNEVLAPHLERYAVYPSAALVGKPGHKGGFVTTARMTHDIKLRLLGDKRAYCTTFFDFYGLDVGFAGKEEADRKTSIQEKAKAIETALKQRVLEITDDKAVQRFLPYIQMHEFEGLLFSHPAKLAEGLYAPELETDFAQIRRSFASPEEINDSPTTAPSKRILSLMPRYEKPLYGSLAAIEIGLEAIRSECQRFDNWVDQLQKLGQT